MRAIREHLLRVVLYLWKALDTAVELARWHIISVHQSLIPDCWRMSYLAAIEAYSGNFATSCCASRLSFRRRLGGAVVAGKESFDILSTDQHRNGTSDNRFVIWVSLVVRIPLHRAPCPIYQLVRLGEMDPKSYYFDAPRPLDFLIPVLLRNLVRAIYDTLEDRLEERSGQRVEDHRGRVLETFARLFKEVDADGVF